MKKRRLNLTKFQISIFIILAIGIFFRFFNLGQKFYWHDEIYTSLRISGYTKTELVEQLYNGQIISVDDLHKYQRVNSEKGVADTVRGLALEEPQHPPLYYGMSRLWAQIFGSSVATIRSLAAVCSLLVFPSIYWLCLELFEFPIVGWMAMGLIAVSPFHILYAQEARQYSLWTATILLSSAALLKALRWENQEKTERDRARAWIVYAATLALGFYTHLLSGFVAVSHGIYVVFVTQHARWFKTVRSYFIASTAAFLMFVPWAIVILTNKLAARDTTNWTTDRESRLKIAKTLMGNLMSLFVDFQAEHYLTKHLIYLAIPIFCLFIYAFYYLIRHTPKQVWLFLMIPVGMILIVFILPDLIFGTRRSAARFLIPLYLSLQISIAYFLATQISPTSVKNNKQKLWKITIVALIFLGIFSNSLSSQADTWWNKSYDIPQMAQLINTVNYPLIISDKTKNPGNLLSLSYRLKPETRYLLLSKSTVPPEIFNANHKIFLFEASNKLLEQLKQKYPVKSLYKQRLWQLEN